jgi:glycogen synthase
VEGGSPGDVLKNLVSALKERSGERVVVLIDEYDAPIQSQIGDGAQAVKNREVLHDFYSALKTLTDPH